MNPRYQWYRHCEILADVLQKVADGEIKRLMVFEPPRHGKSEEISRLFSAYFLYRYPHRWVGLCSYAAELAFTLSRASRENFIRAGGDIKSDAAAVKHWETNQGGGLWAAGVGGPITGKGFHLGIIDDPIKNAEEAASSVIQIRNMDWLDSTFYTREEPWDSTDPDAAIILIQTRWHEADMAGELLGRETQGEVEDDTENWHIVNLPAICEDEPQIFPPSCTLEPDWRETGEALCPERRPLTKLKSIAAKIGGYFFGALFQQRPTAKEGAFFKVAQFQIVDEAPVGIKTVRSWDKAATEGAGDYTAGVKVAGPDTEGYWYIVDVVRGQLSTDTRNSTILQTSILDGVKVAIRGSQDPGAAGVDEAKAFCRMLAGFNVKAVRESGSKEVRADPYSAQVNAGNFRLVKGSWNRAFIEEHRSFPTGKHDDQVDAGANGFNELAGTGILNILKKGRSY